MALPTCLHYTWNQATSQEVQWPSCFQHRGHRHMQYHAWLLMLVTGSELRSSAASESALQPPNLFLKLMITVSGSWPPRLQATEFWVICYISVGHLYTVYITSERQAAPKRHSGTTCLTSSRALWWPSLVVNLTTSVINWNLHGRTHLWGIFFLITSFDVGRPTSSLDLWGGQIHI